jgi:hypothetical protein
VVDERVHVAARHAPKQLGRAELGERLCPLPGGLSLVPVGLREDADAKALVLEHAPDHRGAEADVIDVGVAGHEDHVALFPTERVHLGA